jgi:adenine-specific DNA-methyltransferase
MNKIQKRIAEIKKILRDLGLPEAQQNERSALTFLALLNLKPNSKFTSAKQNIMGVTPIMDWIHQYYKKLYAPNSRETFRRFTLHQFIEGGIVIYNPDKPDRPTNSPKACYQISSEVIYLLKKYKTPEWNKSLQDWLKNKKTLTQKYSQERTMNLVRVKLSDGTELSLSPGKHNKLIKEIINDFAQRFAPGALVVYIGDTGSKEDFFDDKFFIKYGFDINLKSKLPDVILYRDEKKWLYLIESVTSHGPVDSKRKIELEKIFNSKDLSNIYVTAFNDRASMRSYLADIAWESEVWVSSDPSHLIHFNGDKFMGPFEK